MNGGEPRGSDTTVSGNDVLLSVTGLEGGYEQVQILWGVDLEVSTGEMVAIIGSNGAGKTTFLKTISGIVRTRAGTIVFDGIALESATAKEIVEHGISHVPEGRRLFAAMNIEDNLLMGGYARGLKDRALADDLERVYGIFPILKDRRKQLAGSMSGGEQQMCAIARGLMARPRLLLIDELSLGLAPRLVGFPGRDEQRRLLFRLDALDHLTEHRVLAVKPGCGGERHKELGSTGVRPGVCHR